MLRVGMGGSAEASAGLASADSATTVNTYITHVVNGKCAGREFLSNGLAFAAACGAAARGRGEDGAAPWSYETHWHNTSCRAGGAFPIA